MVEFTRKETYDFQDLVQIISLLRGPGGCPWDREQTHESIRRNFIEEAYEAVEAIDEQDADHLEEELGDVLLQILLHAEMEREKGNFDINGVANRLSQKMILRHPHVFGEVKVSGSEEVLTNWDAIKRVEKDQKTVTDSLNSVARSLPSLWRAEKVQKKAAKAGFDWPDVTGALDKLEEEIRELREAVAEGKGIEGELGDVLFSAVNVSRFLKIDPEEALTGSTDKFIRRFAGMEQAASDIGKKPEEMTLEEMDELYNKAKEREV